MAIKHRMKRLLVFLSVLTAVFAVMLCFDSMHASAATVSVDEIKQTLADNGIPYDDATQKLLVVQINSTQSDHLRNFGLDQNQVDAGIKDFPYLFSCTVDGKAVTDNMYHIAADGTVKEAAKHYSSPDVADGTNVIIVDNDSQFSFSFNTGQLFYSWWRAVTPDFANGEENLCQIQPRGWDSVQDLKKSGSMNGEDRIFEYNFEYDIFTWIELETHNINTEKKNTSFIGDYGGNLEGDTGTEGSIKYVFELRDENGSIFPCDSLMTERYSNANPQGDWYTMLPGGVYDAHFLNNGQYYVWEYPYEEGECGFAIPAGYDFRINPIYVDETVGVPVGIWSDDITSRGIDVTIDDEGFVLSSGSQIFDQFIFEYVFMKPSEQIRVEKKVNGNASADAAYTFIAQRSSFVTNDGANPLETVHEGYHLPMQNYPYTVYDSATDQVLGKYRTDENGEFQLKANTYALFDVWKLPADFLDYDYDNYWGIYTAYQLLTEMGAEFPTSAVYAFTEESGSYVTRIEHTNASGTSPVDGRTIEGVENGDIVLFINEPVGTFSVTYASKPDAQYGEPDGYVLPIDGNAYALHDLVVVAPPMTSDKTTAVDSATGKTVNGVWSFGPWDHEDFAITEDTTVAGTWKFTPDEQPGEEPGNNQEEPADPSNPTIPGTPADLDEQPDTGDASDRMLWIVLLAISGAVVFGRASERAGSR